MARKKETPEVLPETKVNWEDMTNGERDDSIKRGFAAIIIKTSKTAREENKPEMAFWNKNMSLEEMDNSTPFNAADGHAYENTTQIILRCISALNGYENPQFLTAPEANRLGGTLKKELDENGKEKLTANGKTAYVKGIKIPFNKKGEWVTQKDKEGRPILTQAKDKEGKLKFDEKGNPVMREVKEYREYKTPMLETTTLYHISQFDNLDSSKLKERDLTKIYQKREYFAKNPDRALQPEVVTSLGISARIAENLHNFIKANKTGKDFTHQNIQTKELDRSAKKEFAQGMAM